MTRCPFPASSGRGPAGDEDSAAGSGSAIRFRPWAPAKYFRYGEGRQSFWRSIDRDSRDRRFGLAGNILDPALREGAGLPRWLSGPVRVRRQTGSLRYLDLMRGGVRSRPSAERAIEIAEGRASHCLYNPQGIRDASGQQNRCWQAKLTGWYV